MFLTMGSRGDVMVKITDEITWYRTSDCLPKSFELCLSKVVGDFPVASYCIRYTSGESKWFTVGDVEMTAPNWWASMPFGPNIK